MTQKTIIEIEWVHMGHQPRAYADSVYEAYISCRVEGVLTKNRILYKLLDEDVAQELTKMFVRPFSKQPERYDTKLEFCTPVGPTKKMEEDVIIMGEPKQNVRWHVKVVEPYID